MTVVLNSCWPNLPALVGGDLVSQRGLPAKGERVPPMKNRTVVSVVSLVSENSRAYDRQPEITYCCLLGAQWLAANGYPPTSFQGGGECCPTSDRLCRTS